MTREIRSTRFHVRKKIKIPLKVFYTESIDGDWSEDTLTEDITICGIAFTLSHPIEPNHPVRFTLPMPRQFRLFDLGKEQYDVWGLVRYVRLIESGSDDQIRLMVGVALIGNAPPSSIGDPTIGYDLKPGLRDKSFWGFREIPRRSGPYVRSLEERRSIEMKVNIKTIGKQGKIIESAEANTINISESGIALVTKLNSDSSRYFLIETEDKTVSLVAAVRAKFVIEDSENSLRLHMEFISGKWIFN